MGTEDQDLVEDETPAASGTDDDILRAVISQNIQGQGTTEPSPPEPADPEAGTQLGEFEENDQPRRDEVVGERPFNPQEGMHRTRTRLAMGLLILVGVLALAPTVALIFGKQLEFTTDAYREVSAMFTPLIALASAAFGFFFASDDRNRP
ncbi:hypothetical protein ACFV7R_35055 [Streptomyces sp. NPDC059866]|uniref:hypothetical protein n=1 Tax=Streptomyces sp. NPDC059866 TaxID=3346978 RepID=UPI003649612A